MSDYSCLVLLVMLCHIVELKKVRSLETFDITYGVKADSLSLLPPHLLRAKSFLIHQYKFPLSTMT